MSTVAANWRRGGVGELNAVAHAGICETRIQGQLVRRGEIYLRPIEGTLGGGVRNLD
jgi:hypothetical protein